MSENITKIIERDEYQYRKSQRSSRKRVFDLGGHCYSGAPGLSWRTNYWVKKLGKGAHWELYASQEESIKKREYSGTFTPDELREYFDSVDFYLEEWEWLEMGLGFSAEVNNIRGTRIDIAEEI